jgi:hypothetical protein
LRLNAKHSANKRSFLTKDLPILREESLQ